MKKVILVSSFLVIGAVALCFVSLSDRLPSTDSQLFSSTEALTRYEEPAGGTCCSRVNDVCIVGAVKLPDQYLRTETGPCP